MEESASGDGPEKDRPRCSTNVVFAREEVWVEGKDSPLIEKVNDEFREYSQSGNCPSIPGIAPDQILQVVVGPNHIAVLLKDGYVYRVRYEYSKIKEAETVTKEEVDTSAPASDQAPRPPSSSHQRAGPKFRRVMMAGSIGNTIGGYYRLRNVSDVRSVIIDSRRNANSSVVVPEDLVAQAQVVLQGRSRDVIVRELQRTNLNVNEAVNNLLSRDDDDDGDDITNEVLLPEELLQLLDSHTINPAVSTREVRTDQLGTSEISSTGNTNDNSNDVLDFSTSRSAIINAVKQAKSRAGRKKKEIEIEKNSLKIEQQIEQWVDTSKSTKETDTGIKFKKIAATSWNLYGISVSGQLYRWAWGKLLVQLYSGIHFDDQHLTDIVASNIRIAVKGTGGRVLSFLDETACGLRASDALRFIGYIPPDKEQNYESLHVSDYLVAVKCGNSCLWGGLIPLADRSKIFEAETAKYRKKHVSFEDNCSDAKVLNDIREGDKVQLKSQPIYPAGSVGIFIDATKPMIGVLQKDVWKATEKSPFKITDPLAFDLEFSIKQEVQEENEQEVQGVQEGSRKRRATSHPADTGESEEIVTWGVDEVIWIHEHRRKDVATVTKMDGPYVVIDYSDESFNNRYASWKSYSIKENHPRSDLSQLQRIVRKDEVRKITSKAARNRSPKVKQSDFKVIDIDHSRKVLSIVCDPNGFRMLIKAGNHIYMSRVLITGKIFSTRRLPLFAPSLLARGPAKLLTFGDARTIYVQDGFGTLYPMLRDAVNGFREPLSVLASTGHLVATLAKPIEEVTRISTNGSFWEGMFLCVPNSTTPLHNLYLPSCTSLAQLVLFADVDGVKKFLDLMNDIREHVLPFQEYSQWMEEELCGQPLDCTSNVLHAAICQSIALVNSQNYDVEKNKPAKASTNDDRWTSSFSQIPSDEVDPQKQKEWGRILRDRTPKSDTSAKSKSDKGLKFSTIKRKSDDGDRRPGKRSLDNMTIRPEEFPVGQAYKDPQTRQKNSLAIVDLLLTHLAIIKGPSRKKAKRARTLNVSLDTTASTDTVHSDDAEMDDSRDPQSILRAMLCCKNSSGMTPFMLAVNIRAYGAASAIWTSIKKLKKKRETINMRYVFPTSDGHFNPDDSPLFVLCYNDPCSFTWTGEDHINQDIYECRTCGLTGSLCCCTECAFTCHRNHDCKQKRTAPTAYCDCWEKCKCKALIEGNDDKRKLLFMELLKHTRLYEMLNGRKEHIMLFLARTVARQIREQASSEKLKKRRHNDHHRDQGNVPEHNLEPPKFARFSLNECLKQYNVLKSAIIVGCANIGKDELMSQEEYVARIQSGSTHLDKLLFTLLSKGMADYLSLASTTLVESDVVKKRDVGYEHVVLRYVRSIVRIIALCTNLSPQAACAVITQKVNEQQSTTSKKDENRIRIMSAIGFSGLLPMFKKEAKVDKALGIAELMVRAIGTLKMLSAPAALELCAAADAILAPVRIGMVRKLSNPVVTGNHDPLEILEKYFATEKSLSEVLDLKKMELHDSVRTKRKSRGAGAAEDHAENHSDGRDSGDDGGSDNEAVGDVTVSSRHRGDSTGGGTVGTARRHPPAVEEVEMAERSFGDDGSSSSSDSEDDDERDDDDVDEEEENADGAESNFRLFQSDMYEMEEEERDGENDDWGMESSSSEGDGDQNDEDRQDSDHDQDDDQMEDEEENDAQEDQGDAERQGAEPQEQEEQPVEAIHLPPPAIRRRVFGSFDDDDGPNENHEPDEQRNAVEAALDAAVEQHEEDGAILGDFLERQHSVAARFGRGEGLPADLTSSGHSTSNMNPAELPSRDTGTSNTREVRGSAIFTGFRRYNRQSSSNTSASTSEPTESNEDASNTRSSTTAPAVSVAVTTTTSGASSKKSPVPTPDPNNLPSKLQAEQQLSMTFSVLVRIAVDILLNKMLDETSSNTKRTSFKTILDLCEQLLSDSFRWLVKVLDHTENTLRFLAGRRPTKAAKKEKDSPTSPSTTSSKKDKDDSPVSAAANRKVTLGYIASVLRSVRDENADTKLQLDDEILPSMAMVLDAYFVFVTSVSPNFEEWKIRLDQFSNPLYRATDKRNFVDRDILTQFFQRGKDQFDPILLLTGEWDSTQPTVPVEKQIPLISNPSVLQMEATQRDLFHNPENQVKLTHSQHVRNLTLLGVPSESRASMALTNHSSIITSTLKAYNNAPVADEPIYEEEPAPECPEGFEKCSLEELREGMRLVFGSDSGRMRMRWEKSIEYMSEMTYSTMTSYFGDCMPLSFSPLVAYVSRFSIRHELFSRTLEKFRVSHGMAKEISLDVERDPTKMMTETIRQINTIYARRICSMPPANLDHKTPLACARLRVKFHSEPGEGTGVTRSFYTAFAEVCSSRKSPFSGLCESASNSLEMIAMLPNGPEAKEKRERVMKDKLTEMIDVVNKSRDIFIDINAAPYDPIAEKEAHEAQPDGDRNAEKMYISVPATLTMYKKLLEICDNKNDLASRIMGIMFNFPVKVFTECSQNDDSLRLYVTDIKNRLTIAGVIGFEEDINSVRVRADSPSSNRKHQPGRLMSDDEDEDTAMTTQPSGVAQEVVISSASTLRSDADPLFNRSSKGFLSPEVGNGSPLRLNAFRNIGRIIGICLSHGDIFPLNLSRHVFKYILRQPIRWIDLAFYDPEIFNHLVLTMNSGSEISTFYLGFSTDSVTDNGTLKHEDLKPNGENIPVDDTNVVEYVYRTAENKMLGKNTLALEALRDGVLDVIPENILSGLTAEDLRLMMCGVDEVNIPVLKANTVFLDESRAPAATLAKFKEMFWQVIEAFSPQEKQDLIFFWTGAPTLQASGDWQNNATVMMRPSDDQYLPTANTCISRIYVPVYSSKKILKSKLTLAIKSKVFGFV